MDRSNQKPGSADAQAIGPAPRTPAQESQERRQLIAHLSTLTVDRLQGIARLLSGGQTLRLDKLGLCGHLAELLTFASEADFSARFGALPQLARMVIARIAFVTFLPVTELESACGLTLLERKREFGSNWKTRLPETSPVYGLVAYQDPDLLTMPLFLRKIFAAYLPKPPGYTPQPMEAPTSCLWTTGKDLPETLRLALDGVQRLAQENSRSQIALKGLQTGDAKKLAAQSGLSPFPLGSTIGLSVGRLMAQTLAAFAPARLPAIPDTESASSFLSALVGAFFSAGKGTRSSAPSEAPPGEASGSVFELRALLDHLTKKSGLNNYRYEGFPPIRQAFREALTLAFGSPESATGDAQGGGAWYSPDALFDACALHGMELSLLTGAEEMADLALRVDAIEPSSGGQRISRALYEKHMSLQPALHALAVGRPLFRAYCYLFALLGLLEIAETKAPRPAIRDGDRLPISAYDSLAAVRITPLGLWCLGLARDKPLFETAESAIIPDPQLFIVSLEGESLEKRIFLESIGTKIGADRFRITAGSFTAGCGKVTEIERRIERFGAYTQGEIAQHWKDFFDSLVARSRIFEKPQRAYVFRLPPDPTLAALFTEDATLRSLCFRAEGGRIVVASVDMGRFARALEERGIHCPIPGRESEA